MTLTEVKTEKVYGRISNVYIGVNATTGLDINSGIKSFTYERVHDARTAFNVSAKTTDDIFQPHSNFTWRLEFLSDCRIAFFATDVQATAGNQYAMGNDVDSNEIEYFRVIVPIEDGSGVSRTRTYTIDGGYALRNGAYIGDDDDAIFWYEGIAKQITYTDA